MSYLLLKFLVLANSDISFGIWRLIIICLHETEFECQNLNLYFYFDPAIAAVAVGVTLSRI